MKATEVLEGQYISRVHEDGRYWGIGTGLTITRVNGELWYAKGVRLEKRLRKDSSAYFYDDFYLCDRNGKKLNKEDLCMEYDTAIVIVLSKSSNVYKSFSSEEEAHSWISEEIKKDPLANFKVWLKPDYEVKHKKVDISELIHRL